jgi:hypothetical protein
MPAPNTQEFNDGPFSDPGGPVPGANTTPGIVATYTAVWSSGIGGGLL